MILLRRLLPLIAAMLVTGCAGVPGGAGAPAGAPIVVASETNSDWPVDQERRPGLWIRLEASPGTPPVDELLSELRIVIDHGGRTQRLDGADFQPLSDGPGSAQTRYLYTPLAGTLFVTLELRHRGRGFFPDTQRIELNDDCWNLLSYRVRGPLADDGMPPPPPYPRTALLSAALATGQPVYRDVFLSGNCFRNPLPPH